MGNMTADLLDNLQDRTFICANDLYADEERSDAAHISMGADHDIEQLLADAVECKRACLIRNPEGCGEDCAIKALIKRLSK
jgi:hypothetical protein